MMSYFVAPITVPNAKPQSEVNAFPTGLAALIASQVYSVEFTGGDSNVIA